jgi:flagellar assembly factor FliW
MTFNFLGPGLTVNVEAKVKEQIILDSSDKNYPLYELIDSLESVMFVIIFCLPSTAVREAICPN